MPLASRLSAYFRQVRVGVVLILMVGIVRFLMLPVFGVGYDAGTTFTSLNILVLVLGLVYAFMAVRKPGTTYLDLLGILFVLALVQSLTIALAVVVDDVGGIETYYTAPGHGGEVNTILHAVAHLTGIVIVPLVLWIPASLMKLVFGRR